GRVAACRAHETSASSPRRNAAAPPCDGWRTYAPPNASEATRPTVITLRPRASSRANGSPSGTSRRGGGGGGSARPGASAPSGAGGPGGGRGGGGGRGRPPRGGGRR